MGGNPEISGNVVFVHESCKLHAAANDTPYSGGDVRIDYKPTPTDETAVVYGVNNENEGKFTLVYPEDKYLIPSEGNLVFSSTPPADEHTHGVDGGEGDIVWTKWDGKTNLTEAGYYYLAENAEPTAAIEVTADVHLCLNGCTISRTGGNEVFSVTGKLTICDCEGGGTVRGTRSGGALGVSGGTATITGGTVNGVKLQNRAELYLGGAPDVGTVSMAKSGTAKGYDNQIFAAADGTAYAGDKITLTSDDDNIPENTVIVRSVNDDNKGLFELTDYALEKSGDDLIIQGDSVIELPDLRRYEAAYDHG